MENLSGIMGLDRSKENIWVVCSLSGSDHLLDIPGFLSEWEYEMGEFSFHREFGRIETKHAYVRFFTI